jgi:outer membrane biosynthesis protein TonB
MKTGTTISVIAHAAVLAFGLVAFAPAPKNAPPPESLPVDIISATEFSTLSKGSRAAPKAETPKPLVERVAEPKPADNPAPKVVDKPEITATADQPKPPEPKVAEQPKPAPPKPEPKPREAFASEAQPKPDPIAEAIKKDQAKKPETKPEPQKQATPTPPKKPEQQRQQPKFDASRIAALLDKRDPQRRAATGETLSPTPALGVPTGNAPRLTQNEIDALRARLRECWNLPVGVAEARDLIVTVRIAFNKDGSLSSEPAVMNHGSHPVFQVAAESALRAVRRCAPYSFLPIAKYDSWKDVIVDFDPRDMFRG